MFHAAELIWLLGEEIPQRQLEGCDVRGLELAVRRAGRDVRKLDALYDRVAALKPDPVLARKEPSDLAGIRKLRPLSRPRIRPAIAARRLRDRLQGAMLGRCAGCLLGKPVEGWSRERIRKALERDGRYPLKDYFEQSTIIKGGKPEPVFGTAYCTRGHFNCMDRDDDIDYTILGVHILRMYGPGFTTQDVANELLHRLPYYLVFTAERVAYKNLVASLPLEQVPVYRNPFREWIGPAIRCDGFAYCAAGMPQLAAEFSYRDGSLSHVRNGIYGGMMFAGMIATAAVSDDLDEVIEAGLAEIPAESRLAVAVRDTVGWCRDHRDWRDTAEAIYAKYGHYNPVHIINNACLVVMGLCHGKKDFSRTITITCMGGLDTDCTSATAGSIAGAMLGAERLPARWVRPLNNRLRSFVVGYADSRITDIADTAFEVNRKFRRGRPLRRPRFRTIVPC